MMRKLLIVVLCGLLQSSVCSRMRFDQNFHDGMYRPDSHMHTEPVFRREHFFPREPMVSPEQMPPQQNMMRNEPLYGNEAIMAHPPQQQAMVPPEDFFRNEQIIPSEPIMRNDAFIRAEPIFRREPFIRREPMLRREPIIRSGRFYPNYREAAVFRNEPYALMVSQCSCPEPQNIAHGNPQEELLQIPQPIQPLPQQPMMAPRLIIQKPIIKPQTYQPIIAFPRFQRIVRKNFKPPTENIQFSAPAVQNTPVQDFNAFNSEPVPFSTTFQNQGQQPENTSEPNQNNPVTVRNVPQMSNPLALAQMSSIC